MKSAKGFTILELMIVLGLFTMVVALGLFVSFDTYRATLARSESDTVVGLLGRARSNAMANLYNSPWGLCYIEPNYIVFRGTACTAGAATNEPTPAGNGVAITGLTAASPVVFSQLAGTTTLRAVTVTQGAKTTTIDINYEGRIE